MARAPRGPVSTTIGDTQNRPLLRFDARQEALQARLDTFRGRAVPVQGGDGLALNAAMLLNATAVGIPGGGPPPLQELDPLVIRQRLLA